MKKTLLTILAAWFVSACAQAPPEHKTIDEVAEALGGKARLEQMKTLTIEGEGAAPNLGQNLTPDSELPVWKLTEYRRAVDLANNRMRVQQVRTAQFLFAGATTQRLDQGIDGDVGYNVSENGMATRTAGAVVRDRRAE